MRLSTAAIPFHDRFPRLSYLARPCAGQKRTSRKISRWVNGRICLCSALGVPRKSCYACSRISVLFKCCL